MDSNTEDRVGTLIKVDMFLSATDVAAALAANTNIEAERVILAADTENVFQADSTATRPLQGFTQMKKNARTDLENIVLLGRAGGIGYYTANSDPGKLMILKFSDTKVKEARDNDLHVLADQVHDVLNPIKALLVPFSVTAANVDAIPTLRDTYRDMLQLPRTEEAISIAAAQQRDRLVEKCFTQTLITLDAYLLPYKYTNEVLYSRYLTARAIDESGGGADSNGYEVHNYKLEAGESRSFSPAVAPGQQLYFRQIGGTVGAIICTAGSEDESCSAGFTLVPGTTVKKTFAELGLADGAFINFTNPGSETITIRAGLKSS